eukprot:scaffold8651_cov134-Skeletonema_marinoi.AAC.2
MLAREADLKGRENQSKEAVGMEHVAACTHCEGDGLLIKPCQHNRSRFPGVAFLPEKSSGYMNSLSKKEMKRVNYSSFCD